MLKTMKALACRLLLAVFRIIARLDGSNYQGEWERDDKDRLEEAQ
jgi:hypothetical protein